MKNKWRVIKRDSMFTTVENKDANTFSGQFRELETLAGKSRRYADDLSLGGYFSRRTESFVNLSPTQLAYRSGYLKARSDSSKVWKKDNPWYNRDKSKSSFKVSEFLVNRRVDNFTELFSEIESVESLRKAAIEKNADRSYIEFLDSRLKKLKKCYRVSEKIMSNKPVR